ncbi:MAG: hypothetical protein E6I87_06305 [Chloroflexi bacterium]|nr:MAG: hypothetical protein E6I87_06305 [Chloroflexota bacterium]
MASWRALLRGDPLPWLLERRDAPVRAGALELIEERSSRDPELREAKARAMTSPPISTILKRQYPDGTWGEDWWKPKYTASHWEMLLLVEYGADGADPRVRRGARKMLDAMEPKRESPGWLGDHGVSCIFGSLLRYLCHAGFGADERVEWIVDRLVRDSKVFEAGCYINGDLPCAWGYARLLWGLAALPEQSRTREVERTLRRGTEWLLSYKLERGAYPTDSDPSHLWRSANFPLFYQADVLFVLRVLAQLDALSDTRAAGAIAWLLSRQDERGRWHGRAPYLDRMPSKIDADKWITLQAAHVLKSAFPEDG